MSVEENRAKSIETLRDANIPEGKIDKIMLGGNTAVRGLRGIGIRLKRNGTLAFYVQTMVRAKYTQETFSNLNNAIACRDKIETEALSNRKTNRKINVFKGTVSSVNKTNFGGLDRFNAIVNVQKNGKTIRKQIGTYDTWKEAVKAQESYFKNEAESQKLAEFEEKARIQLRKTTATEEMIEKIIKGAFVAIDDNIYVKLRKRAGLAYTVIMEKQSGNIRKSFGSFKSAVNYRDTLLNQEKKIIELEKQRLADEKKQKLIDKEETAKKNLAAAKAKIANMELPVGIAAYPRVDGTIRYVPSLTVNGNTRNFGAQNSLVAAVKVRKQKAKEFGIKPREVASRKQQEINLGKNEEGIATNLFSNKIRADSSTGYRGVIKWGTGFKGWITVKGVRYFSDDSYSTPKEAYYKGRLPLEEEHLNFKPKKKD